MYSFYDEERNFIALQTRFGSLGLTKPITQHASMPTPNFFQSPCHHSSDCNLPFGQCKKMSREALRQSCKLKKSKNWKKQPRILTLLCQINYNLGRSWLVKKVYRVTTLPTASYVIVLHKSSFRDALWNFDDANYHPRCNLMAAAATNFSVIYSLGSACNCCWIIHESQLSWVIQALDSLGLTQAMMK